MPSTVPAVANPAAPPAIMRPTGVPGVRVRLLRLWFAAASRLAPGVAERHAARLFLTPRRRTPRDPALPGHTARRLDLVASGFPVVAWSWGEGPTVLLVHGWSGRAADLDAMASALVQGGFRAVAVDLPAHGRSPGRRTSLAEWRLLLPDLAEQLGGVHAVIAHSLGAAAATLALEAGLRARGAVLIAPPRGPTEFVDRVRRFLGLPVARRAGMERALVAHVGRELAFFDTARAAASLTQPALVLHDPADPEVPWSHGEALARAWAGSELVPVAGDGHYRILTSPAVVARAVDFVARLRVDADGADRAAPSDQR
jgi:pimeloyl-ACP methyl ester carboxylesterase